MIKRSRKFVCVRIDPYEAEENSEWVRKLWQGRLTNSVFAILEPDGQDMETRGGRSPSMVLGTGEALYASMDRIAEKHSSKGDGTDCLVPDSHSLSHMLNTASCDQVALAVVVVPSGDSKEKVEESLREVVWHKSLQGQFHWDIVSEDDKDLKRISGAKGDGARILVVRPGVYGKDGAVIENFDAEDDGNALVAGLGKAAHEFFDGHTTKEYQAHVRAGHRAGEEITQEVPYGEDRDGDGKADERGGGGKKGGGKGAR